MTHGAKSTQKVVRVLLEPGFGVSFKVGSEESSANGAVYLRP